MSTPGVPSQRASEGTSSADTALDCSSLFLGLLAGLVEDTVPAEGDNQAGSSSGALRQSLRPVDNGTEPTPSAGAARPAAKRSTAGKLTASPAASRAESDHGQLSASQIITAIKLPPAMDAGTVGQSTIPECGSLSGGDGESTRNNANQSSGQTPALDISAVQETTPLKLETGLALPPRDETARVANHTAEGPISPVQNPPAMPQAVTVATEVRLATPEPPAPPPRDARPVRVPDPATPAAGKNPTPGDACE